MGCCRDWSSDWQLPHHLGTWGLYPLNTQTHTHTHTPKRKKVRLKSPYVVL